MSALRGSSSVSFPHRTALLLAGVLVLCVSATAAPAPRQAPPPCPGGADLAARVNSAGKVFEGKARTRSLVKDGAYNVTFTVKHIYKGEKADFGNVKNPQVRLLFSGRQQCGVATIKPGRKYIVFVDSAGPHVYRPRGEPVARNRENVQAVKDAVCRASLRLTGQRKNPILPKDTLKLQCKTKGVHLPRVHWYKDGVKLEPSASTRIRVKKKRLIINSVWLEDTGVYECRAVIAKCGTVAQSTRITVEPEKVIEPETTRPTTTTYWPMSGQKCPIDSFCLNGGVCSFYDVIGEMSCQCAEGFKGQRCDVKTVNASSTYRHLSYFCKLGISDRFYC